MQGNHLVAIASVIGATIVTATGHDGWGWLITVAIIAILS